LTTLKEAAAVSGPLLVLVLLLLFLLLLLLALLTLLVFLLLTLDWLSEQEHQSPRSLLARAVLKVLLLSSPLHYCHRQLLVVHQRSSTGPQEGEAPCHSPLPAHSQPTDESSDPLSHRHHCR